jgi:hypothetical protein
VTAATVHAKLMIHWLKDKDPEVWFAITPMLNWDNAMAVLEWIVSQPQCDKANAAAIFWGAGPAFHARRLAHGDPTIYESWGLIELILRNWNAEFYTRSEFAWPDEDGKNQIAHYEQQMREQPAAREALPIPSGLLGPIKGREPRVPKELMPSENVKLWDLLDRLGTQAGFRPGSELWIAQREGRWKPYEPPKPSLALRLFGKQTLSPADVLRLALAATALVLGSFLFLRWMVL